MSTNATFSWIPQAGILAQEVWYGRLTDVGSTLPPATGWNQGNNLYNATASTTQLNNLDENTKYQFAVLEHCSAGSSPWSIVTKYKLVCPTVSTILHATSVDVTLSVINAGELSKVIDSLVLNLVDPSTGNPINGVNFSGSQITSSITWTFSGLTASTPYQVVLGYTLIPGGALTNCSTSTVNTAALVPCTPLTFTFSNITTTGFTINVPGLQGGDSYDVFLSNSDIAASITTSTYNVSNLTPGTTYSVNIRRNCSNATTGMSPSQNVTTINSLIGTISMTIPNPYQASQQVTSIAVTFPTPTTAPVTLHIGALFEQGCGGCASGLCKEPWGGALFTYPVDVCSGFPQGAPGEAPYLINIPAGVTNYTATNIQNDPPTTFPLLTLNPNLNPGHPGRGWTDLYVKVLSPSGIIPAFTYQNSTNIQNVTVHNITS